MDFGAARRGGRRRPAGALAAGVFGVGIAIYFAAAQEPQTWASVVALLLAAGLTFAARRTFLPLGLALAVCAVAGGILAGRIATLRAEAPKLERGLRAEVVGRVVRVEPRQQGRRRVTLAVERFGALEDEVLPARARVTLGKAPTFTAGDRISLTAYWRPPDGPVRPGGYDFARVAFYQGLGATAFAPTGVTAHGPADDGALGRASSALERLRERLTERITTAVGGPEGTVAAALVTGVQGPIPQQTEDELRAAGLSHILSISGLHMALIAGTLFWLSRAAMALSPALALRYPVKQISAAAALAGATFYLALSGAEVATQRSYIMIAIAFAAILVGRPALSLRNFAIAALIVMAWTPEAMLGPSFQMSFAAVAALLAWFEARSARPPTPQPESRTGRALRWIFAAATIAVVTTLIAGLATAPFAAYHFQRLTPYSLAGNALASPLLSLIVMPSVVGGLAFAPLGLDGPWWSFMGLGLKGVLEIARVVSSWPGSERGVPAFGQVSLVLFACGLAWLCLWRTALRWAGSPILALALLLAAFPSRPDVVIDASGGAIAVRGPDGALAVAGVKPTSFSARVWLAADGVMAGQAAAGAGRSASPSGAASPIGPATIPTVPCDLFGCILPLAGGGTVALVRDARAFDEDCRSASLVVTRLEAPAACAETAAVIDRTTLAATGSLALARDGDVFRAKAARDPKSARPWSIRSDAGPPPYQALRLTFSPTPRATDHPARVQPVDPTNPEDEAPADDGDP